jgi:hypothetical protein
MGTRGPFPGVKRPGRYADHSHPPSAEVKEYVELYLHSSNTSSWRCAQFKEKQGGNFTFTFYHEDIFGNGGIASRIVNLAVDGGEWSASRPGRFTPRLGVHSLYTHKYVAFCVVRL